MENQMTKWVSENSEFFIQPTTQNPFLLVFIILLLNIGKIL